ncbi:MAG: hypothetical protein A3F68_02260 [Acidobacteria bacterium RIFCSPLOWO2_12_FULL_54_10]|nr:MAG: hypothetical protein A3F68_02260 [Acidobacteria bacterium RIFCSPLOWO2_12_FULL_54_10]
MNRKSVLEPSSLYDREFYEFIHPGSSQSAARVAPELINLFSPGSILDVGCGTGAWLAEFRKHGIADVIGVDGDWVNNNQLSIPQELFLGRDLRKPLTLDRQFDLVMTLEVAEHLPPERGESFVSDLVAFAPVVFFSAATPSGPDEGVGEINKRWPGYWANLFAAFDYLPFDYLRFKFWDDRLVEWWYRQNMILYIKQSYLNSRPDLEQILNSTPPGVLSLIHPVHYQEQIALVANSGPKSLLRALPRATIRAIKRRLKRL